MTFVFAPTLLSSLDLKEKLEGKSIAINESSDDKEFILRPLKSSDIGISEFVLLNS